MALANGGTTFVARNFSFPEPSKCSTWTGYTKTGDTVILTTGGTVCLSSDNKALTVSLTSHDPWFLGGGGALGVDYIQLSREVQPTRLPATTTVTSREPRHR